MFSPTTQMNRHTAQRILLILMSGTLSFGLGPTNAQDNPLGQFDGHADIGAPKLAGSAKYDAANQEYTLTAAGTNMWFGRDQCHFVWKRMKGDFILRARAEFVGKGADAHRKLGWMVRPSLDADAPYADSAEHGDGLTSLQFRRAKGANTEQIALPITNASVLQFERKANTYIFSAARYGEPFVSRALTNLDLGDEVYAGLFVCSHRGDVLETATVSRRADHPPRQGRFHALPRLHRQRAGDPRRPQRQAGNDSTAPKQPFEAPNWTTDGKALIYNISGRAEGWGRLARFDLATQDADAH